jgi:hypothetical protein
MSIFVDINYKLSNIGINKIVITENEIYAMDQELDATIEHISLFDNIYSASVELDRLEQQQTILATLLFKYKIQLSEKQCRVVRQCDRLDDSRLRNYVFKLIKKGIFLKEDNPPFA